MAYEKIEGESVAEKDVTVKKTVDIEGTLKLLEIMKKQYNRKIDDLTEIKTDTGETIDIPNKIT
jgi:hypothetical protein